MADKTIEWLHAIRAQDASRPFFTYFSTGCSHAPHHVSEDWAEKYRGKFDQGWDTLREEIFARQKEEGVVPADAELTPRDDAFPAWDDVPDKLKPYYARQMEVYAGYSENADHNVGRVIDAIEELGELDNTMVIWIWGDNGASMEGTITGSFNELTMQNGIPLTDEMQLQLAERYGGVEAWGNQMMAPHYSAAWAWAGNTPFKWGKQVGSHLGGTRNPLVVRWPEKVRDDGALRSHFTHVIDVGPTILDVAGIPMPTHIDGIEQQPMHGVTFADSLTDADAPERHTQQYFETIGNRAMYKDGWWLAMKTERIPWVLTPEALKPYTPGVWDPDDDPVELYYLPDDFTQARDLAAENPEKVKELKELFWQEAERYDVLPLMATLAPFFGIVPPLPEVAKYEFRGDVQNVLSGMIPRIYNHSYSISADLVIPKGGAEGVIVAEADHMGGFSLFVDGGRLTHTYSMMGVFVYRQQAEEALPEGEVTVRMEFAPTRRNRPPAARSRSSSMTVRSPQGGWTTRSRFASRAMQAWTSAATTAASSTWPMRTASRSPSRARSRRSCSTSIHIRRRRTHTTSTRRSTTDMRRTRSRREPGSQREERSAMKLHDTIDVLIGGYLSKDAAEEDYNAVRECGGASARRGRRQQGPRRKPIGGGDRPHGPRGGRGPGRRRLRGRAVRPSAACQRPRSAPRWAARRGGLLHHKTAEQARRGGGRDDPARRRRPDRRLLALRGEKVEPAVTRAVEKTIGEAEGNHVKALKGALADAQEKMAVKVTPEWWIDLIVNGSTQGRQPFGESELFSGEGRCASCATARSLMAVGCHAGEGHGRPGTVAG